MELGIDTSTRYASVALSIDGRVEIELVWRSQRNHSVELVPALRRIMDQAGVDVDGLSAIYVAKGPGGFSALRVGISFAKSLAAAQSIPLVAVGTLDVEAHPFLGFGYPVCAIIDAGRDMAYTATYDAADKNEGVIEYMVTNHRDFLELAKTGIVYCGEGLANLSKGLNEKLGKSALMSNSLGPTRRPGVLAQIGYRMFSEYDIVSPEDLQPLYIRGSQFEVAQRTRLRN